LLVVSTLCLQMGLDLGLDLRLDLSLSLGLGLGLSLGLRLGLSLLLLLLLLLLLGHLLLLLLVLLLRVVWRVASHHLLMPLQRLGRLTVLRVGERGHSWICVRLKCRLCLPLLCCQVLTRHLLTVADGRSCLARLTLLLGVAEHRLYLAGYRRGRRLPLRREAGLLLAFTVLSAHWRRGRRRSQQRRPTGAQGLMLRLHQRLRGRLGRWLHWWLRWRLGRRLHGDQRASSSTLRCRLRRSWWVWWWRLWCLWGV